MGPETHSNRASTVKNPATLWELVDVEGWASPEGPPLLYPCNGIITRGEFLLIRGPSGSGKSTFLRLLARLHRHFRGQLLFTGEPLLEIPGPWFHQQVAWVGQQPAVFPGSVAHNLSLARRWGGIKEGPTDEEALQELGLETGLLPQEAASLSVGQQARLCLARSLLTEPIALLLDEVSSSLDPESAAAILQAVLRRREKRATILWASHHSEHLSKHASRHLSIESGVVEWSLHHPSSSEHPLRGPLA